MLAIWLPCVFLGAANRATDDTGVQAKLGASDAATAGPTLDAAERDRLRRTASGDDVMLRLVEHYAPVWLIRLLSASVMAAVMASDSQILALSTMFTRTSSFWRHRASARTSRCRWDACSWCC
jgi:hypothetical protein